MNSLTTLTNLVAATISDRVLEGCKNARQYAVDKLQTTFNSVTT